jgi:hypothetical protein
VNNRTFKATLQRAMGKDGFHRPPPHWSDLYGVTRFFVYGLIRVAFSLPLVVGRNEATPFLRSKKSDVWSVNPNRITVCASHPSSTPTPR